MRCKQCREIMEYTCEWCDYDHIFYQEFFCADCDNTVVVKDELYHKQVVENNNEHNKIVQDYYNSVI
jgi:predicted RNA-binding Zn-ribbon protein involved in translation (DUF1610 family)